MIRSASRAILHSPARSTVVASARTISGRRFISTDPPHLRSRSWKNSALRWGLAAAGIYYYNTSPVFADQPHHNLLNPNVDALEDETSSTTLDALTASSRRKSQKNASVLQSAVENISEDVSRPEASSVTAEHPGTDIPAIDASTSELEEEAEGQGAFNPVTGEINWDCPCLGGMAHGPCGPEFRDAFSCFVFSAEEPKGMDCIDKFQNMQNCFRAHPEVYKGELEDDEELDAELAHEREELKTQIAERKAAERDTEQNSGNRLLEEPGPAPVKKQRKGSKRSNSKSEASSSQPPQPSARTASTSEPHPGMSEEHEAIHEGQRSIIKNDAYNNPVNASSANEESDLVPKASHDATDAPTPGSK